MRARTALLALSVLAFVALFTTVGRAASVDGKWEGSIQSPQGDFPLTFEFKADGETLTGSVESAMGKLDISNGKIKDNQLTFDVKLDDGSVITHEGTLDGDTIAVKSHGPFGDGDFTLKRVVEKAAGQ
jgi:SOS-response transcriptional repressor LexA